jgi:hypothetical protein
VKKNEIFRGPFREAAKQCGVACEVPFRFRYGNGVRQLNGGLRLLHWEASLSLAASKSRRVRASVD